MGLYVADAELSSLRDNTVDAVKEVTLLGERFLKLLDKMRQMGYVSEAMNTALENRSDVVRAALGSFSTADEPIAKGVSQLISTIDSIDHL